MTIEQARLASNGDPKAFDYFWDQWLFFNDLVQPISLDKEGA